MYNKKENEIAALKTVNMHSILIFRWRNNVDKILNIFPWNTN